MNKLIIATSIATLLGITVSTTANASALDGASTLNFDAGVVTSNAYGSVFFVKSGSYFGMDGNGIEGIKPNERTAISQNNGLVLGTAQSASGSHLGAPGCINDSGVTCTNGDSGPESAGIDAAWNFFGNTGFHTVDPTKAITIVDNSSAGSATLDFSGWGVTWSGIPFINMGSGGTALVTCTDALDCGNGGGFTLDYDAVVPAGDPSGFGGAAYTLHLEGTVSVVPVPAAVWLFGSGLLGLVGVARRYKIT